MTANGRTNSASSAKRRARLRLAGVVVLVIGFCSASIVYWAGTRSPRLEDDLSMVGYDKAQSRQMGQLYGKWGLMVDDLLDDLKQPGMQTAIIAGISALVAFGFFRFACSSERGSKVD